VSGSEHLHAGTPELCAEQRRAADAAVVTARVVAPLEPTVVQPIPPAYAGAGSRALIQRGSPMLLDEAGVVPYRPSILARSQRPDNCRPPDGCHRRLQLTTRIAVIRVVVGGTQALASLVPAIPIGTLQRGIAATI
jgi:hypothetical protein